MFRCRISISIFWTCVAQAAAAGGSSKRLRGRSCSVAPSARLVKASVLMRRSPRAFASRNCSPKYKVCVCVAPILMRPRAPGAPTVTRYKATPGPLPGDVPISLLRRAGKVRPRTCSEGASGREGASKALEPACRRGSQQPSAIVPVSMAPACIRCRWVGRVGPPAGPTSIGWGVRQRVGQLGAALKAVPTGRRRARRLGPRRVSLACVARGGSIAVGRVAACLWLSAPRCGPAATHVAHAWDASFEDLAACLLKDTAGEPDTRPDSSRRSSQALPSESLEGQRWARRRIGGSIRSDPKSGEAGPGSSRPALDSRRHSSQPLSICAKWLAPQAHLLVAGTRKLRRSGQGAHFGV